MRNVKAFVIDAVVFIPTTHLNLRKTYDAFINLYFCGELEANTFFDTPVLVDANYVFISAASAKSLYNYFVKLFLVFIIFTYNPPLFSINLLVIR